jgi:2,3-dihydroxybenzoate decarboxylase
VQCWYVRSQPECRCSGASLPTDRTNIYETSTGNFWTELINFHRNFLGDDRILYSVDYPFNLMSEWAEWVKTLPYSEESRLDFIRNNAIKKFKLDSE